jgi:hypothetical protein
MPGPSLPNRYLWRRRLISLIVVGVLTIAASWYIWRNDDITVEGRIGICSRVLRSLHPSECDWIRMNPTLLFGGPLDSSGTPRDVIVVRAREDRVFEVSLPKGRYGLSIVANGLAYSTRLGIAPIFVDERHSQLGTVAPSDSWEGQGLVTPN